MIMTCEFYKANDFRYPALKSLHCCLLQPKRAADCCGVVRLCPRAGVRDLSLAQLQAGMRGRSL